MAALSRIHLLLVSAGPALPALIRANLQASGLPYRMHDVSTRERFFNDIKSRPPDLVIAPEDGIEGLALGEILEEAQKPQHEIPVVVLGERRRPRSATRILRTGASDYIELEDVDRLPLILERSLREQRTRVSHMRLENEVRHATGLLQENQRLMTIGRLTGSIAHEINNPLESITNLLFLIGHEPGLPARARDYLSMAQRELDRVAQISKQTLNFYRDTDVPVPVRLSGLLDDLTVLYTRRIAEKQIQVIRRFGEEEPLTIFPGEIRQVFSNLIANAIEANGTRGELHLRIRKSHLWCDSAISGLRITIADRGTGMSPEILRRIGEPFFTTKGQGGTGLGLWVTQSIIEQRYGGSLLVRSSTGEHHGTVFSVLLPTNLRPHAVGGNARYAPPGSDSRLPCLRQEKPKDVAAQRKNGTQRTGLARIR
jgi:two-component system, NtrC family, sensor kinase